MFRKVNVPVFGLIENMSYYKCPECGHVDHVFDHGGAHKAADELGVPFLGEIPLDLKIRLGADEGKPIVDTEPDGDHAKAYGAIAEKIAAAVEERVGPAEAPRKRGCFQRSVSSNCFPARQENPARLLWRGFLLVLSAAYCAASAMKDGIQPSFSSRSSASDTLSPPSMTTESPPA